MEVPEALVSVAMKLASNVDANAILVLTESGKNCAPLLRSFNEVKRKPKIIVATSDHQTAEKFARLHPEFNIVKLTVRASGRIAQVQHAVAMSLAEGMIRAGDRLVCLTGNGFADSTDTLFVQEVNGSEKTLVELERDPVTASTLGVAIELGKEGNVGTSFMVGDTKAVLRYSRALILDPFKGYSINIKDKRNWGIIKRYSMLDGSFVVNEDGFIVTAGRYLDAHVKAEVPPGLGTRHLAVASMTLATKATGITLSQEDRMVRIFKGGRLVAKIHPRHGTFEP